jgi:hypothetical protein
MAAAPAAPLLPAARTPALAWSCWAVLMLVALVNALAPAEPFPYWGGDPTRFYTPPVGLTPFWSVALDLAGVLAAGVALLATRRPILRIPLALGVIGALGVSLHALVFRAGGVEDLRLGAAWMAAVLGALAMANLCRDERLRRLTLAVLFGLVAVLLAKGIFQIAVEHAATVERYRHDRAAFLAANGWAPDSPSARMFERRLSQPEATGWFGMSNVFATFAAGSFVALTGLAVLAWLGRLRKEVPDGWAGALTLGAIGAAAAVYLSHSKGGAGVAAIGLGIMVAVAVASRRPSIFNTLRARAGALAVALIALTLAAIAARGLIGERLHELSLLFRWFYTIGAARTFAAHPLTGVGPAGFKDAYMVAKPPISPEEVVSAHSILWDYAATLGLFGVAWAAAFLWLVWRLGRESLALAGTTSTAVEPVAGAHERRRDGWIVFVIASVATLLAARSEIAAQTGDAAVARFAGLVGWIGIAIGALAVMRADPRWRWAAGAGALAMAVHAQIEVTGFWAGAAPLLLITLGAAAAPSNNGAPPRRLPALAAATLLTALTAWWALAGLLPLHRWEGALAAAAREVEPFSELAVRSEELAAGTSAESIRDLARDAGTLAGTPTPESDAQMAEAFRLAYLGTTGRAVDHLQQAVGERPADVQTAEGLVRLRILRAQRLQDPAKVREEVDKALQTARGMLRHVNAAASLGVLGNTLRSAADLLNDPSYRKEAVRVYEQADRLDPYGLNAPLRLFELSRQLEDDAAARRWAAVVLERDALQRLDQEARGLTDSQKREVRAALAMPQPPPGPTP